MVLASMTFVNGPTAPRLNKPVPKTPPVPNKPAGPVPHAMPGKPNKPLNPTEKRLEMEREVAEKKLKQFRDRQKQKMARMVVGRYQTQEPDAYRTAAPIAPTVDPNKDPQYLFQQVRPLLSKMNLANVADGSKTELIIGKIKKTDSLYQVTLRRQAIITEDHIERIKRLANNFESLQWSSQAIRVFVWYPYIEKAQTLVPGAPGSPSVVPGVGQ
jgi:hypothetical protein